MLINWIAAFRPKTLTASLVPVLLGAALASSDGFVISLSILLLILIAAFSIQIGTNLYNDVIDLKRGADSSDRLGPKRALQMGILSEKAVRRGAHVSFLIAMLSGIPLVIEGGLPILCIGLLAIFLGYSYTGGPLKLAYRGLAELFVIAFFGIIAVCGTYFLFAKSISALSILAGIQVGLLATNLLLVNNVRDYKEDKASNKKTIVVRFGIKFGKLEIILSLLLTVLLQSLWAIQNPLMRSLPYLALIPAAIATFKIFNSEPSSQYNKYLGMMALSHLLFGLFLSISLLTI